MLPLSTRLAARIYADECLSQDEIAAMIEEAVRPLVEALEAYERLDDAHANCPECEGDLQPELCAECFPLADAARLGMRAALAAARGQS